MPSIIPLLLALAMVIAAAKMGGWFSTRVGQPAVLGELVAGLLLGPSVLNVFGLPYFEAVHTVETLHALGELGVILLMFAAGLEIHLSDFAKAGRPALSPGYWASSYRWAWAWLSYCPSGMGQVRRSSWALSWRLLRSVSRPRPDGTGCPSEPEGLILLGQRSWTTCWPLLSSRASWPLPQAEVEVCWG